MSTQITSTKVAVDFRNDNIQQIAVDIGARNLSATRTAVVSETTYHIDITQAFPQTPPAWVMSSAHLALLVGDGSLSVA